MLGNLLIGALGVLLVLIVYWAIKRAGRIRAESKAREAQALALFKAGGPAPGATKSEAQGGQGETVFAGMPSQMVPGGRGIEVADVSGVVDIDELLRDEQAAAAERARALLEEPTNIDLTPDTLQPLRGASAAPVKAPVNASIATAAGAAAAMAAARARPAVPKAAAQKAAVAARAAAPHTGGTAVATAPPVARPAAPAVRPAMPAARPAAPARPTPVAQPAKRASADGDVPLRELALAWFEARGYRSAPASPAVRPIELVLRHRDDPGRAYALVVEPSRVTGDRVVTLAEQARAIGLVRLLVVAETGAEPDAAKRKKGVRLMDRPTMNEELKKLDLSIAAKIIAVARKRATARAA